MVLFERAGPAPAAEDATTVARFGLQHLEDRPLEVVRVGDIGDGEQRHPHQRPPTTALIAVIAEPFAGQGHSEFPKYLGGHRLDVPVAPCLLGQLGLTGQLLQHRQHGGGAAVFTVADDSHLVVGIEPYHDPAGDLHEDLLPAQFAELRGDHRPGADRIGGTDGRDAGC